MTAAALGPQERERLSKLLAMLGSDHAGERDAAGLAANRLMQRCGATWSDVLQPVPPARSGINLEAWRTIVAHCLARQKALNGWETEFLRGLGRFWHLTTKQKHVLGRIADRVLGQEAQNG